MKGSRGVIDFFLALVFAMSTSGSVRAEEDVRKMIEDMRAQIEFLTNRVNELEKQVQTENKKKEPLPKQTADAPAEDQPKPVTVGDIKGAYKIPGTDTSLAVGGYVKLDAIYNSVSVGGSGGSNNADYFLVASSIPVGDRDAEDDQVTFHARESRFWLKSHTPTDRGPLGTYLELDFFAFQAPGDERVSNSFAPRLRHAYGQWGHFLAGQTWSTFMNVAALPELNDFGGPVGRVFVRQPQIRWTQPLMSGDLRSDMQFALEAPESTLTDSLGMRVTPDDDRVPDTIVRVNLAGAFGEVSLAGMLRQIRSDSGGNGDEAFGGAINLTGRINTTDLDTLRFMFAYGNALGRYTTLNLFNDGAIDANGNIELFNVYNGVLAYQHWWSPNWRSTLAVGIARAGDYPDFVPETVSKEARSVHVNLLWSPLLQTTFGLEYIFARRELDNGDAGDLHRVQFSSRINF
ncbi:MAG: DcaP family trimeric outer membrane transporter [Pseudomonadota bacterium]